MTDEARHQPSRSFGAAAELYDRARPRYPAEAVEWMLGSAPLRVLDIGAGTGIFTRVLAALGHQVTAVEPDEAMRATLVAGSPGVTALAGTAESIPLLDGSVDAAVAAQAYHWFDPATAHPEIARVLRPEGVIAPIWNLRDKREPWVAELSRLIGVSDAVKSFFASTPDFGSLFEPAARFEVRHSVTHTADSLVALVASRSSYLTATPEAQRRIEAGVRELAAGLPEEFELPYVTVAFRAARR